MINLIMI